MQRFGSALNLNIHLHMLCLDGVYAPRPDGGLRFRRVKAPEREELAHLVQQIAERVARALERMGLLQRDVDDCRDAGGRAKQEPEPRVPGSSCRPSRTRMRYASSLAAR